MDEQINWMFSIVVFSFRYSSKSQSPIHATDQSTNTPIHPPTHQSIHSSSYQPMHKHPSTHTSWNPFTDPSTMYLSILPPTHHSIHPSILPPTHSFIHPSIIHPSIHLRIHPSFIHPSIHLSIHQSTHPLTVSIYSYLPNKGTNETPQRKSVSCVFLCRRRYRRNLRLFNPWSQPLIRPILHQRSNSSSRPKTSHTMRFRYLSHHLRRSDYNGFRYHHTLNPLEPRICSLTFYLDQYRSHHSVQDISRCPLIAAINIPVIIINIFTIVIFIQGIKVCIPREL